MVPLVCAAVYLLAMNGTGFALMGVDKGRSRVGGRRIPEVDLFAVAALGGSLGSWAGMYAFRHKTLHKSFVIGMPVILALQVVGAVVLAILVTHL